MADHPLHCRPALGNTPQQLRQLCLQTSTSSRSRWQSRGVVLAECTSTVDDSQEWSQCIANTEFPARCLPRPRLGGHLSGDAYTLVHDAIAPSRCTFIFLSCLGVRLGGSALANAIERERQIRVESPARGSSCTGICVPSLGMSISDVP